MSIFEQNATKEKAKKVWVSFGIIRNLCPFMDACQMVCLQSANKFCYDIAVSRVQYSIPLPKTFYFTWPGGELVKNIISFSETRGINTTEQSLDLKYWYSVQVGPKSLFQIYYNSTKCRMIKGDQNDQFTSTVLAPPSDSTLYNFSICFVNAKFVYFTGGCNN